MAISEDLLIKLKEKLKKIDTPKHQYDQAKKYLLFCLENYENDKSEKAAKQFKDSFIRLMYLSEPITDLNLLDTCILLNKIFNINAREYEGFALQPEAELTRTLIKRLFQDLSLKSKSNPGEKHNFFISSIFPHNAVLKLLFFLNENSMDIMADEKNVLFETILVFNWDNVAEYFLDHWISPKEDLLSFLNKAILNADGTCFVGTQAEIEASICILPLIINKLLEIGVSQREIIHSFPDILEVAALRKWASVITLLLFNKNSASILNQMDNTFSTLHERLFDIAMTEASCQVGTNLPVPENRVYDTVKALIFAGAIVKPEHIDAAAKQNKLNVLVLLIAYSPNPYANNVSDPGYFTAPSSPVVFSRSQSSEHVEKKNSLNKSLACD